MSDPKQKLIAFRLLRSFCPPQLLEEIEGDLLQQFERDLKVSDTSKVSDTYIVQRAKRRLLWNTIRFFRPEIVMKNKFSSEFNHAYMLLNNFRIAFRHLSKSKLFTAINLVGLSVGLAAYLMIVQYVGFETSFDEFHSNKNEIYRVGLDRYENGVIKERSARTFSGIRRLIRENFPEVKNYTGFIKIPANTGFLFRHNGKIYNETGGELSSDTSFFKVFPSLLVSGNATTVLKEKNNLLISEKIAKKLFGTENPIGKHIERVDDHEDGSDFIITGIVKDIPDNAHFHSNFIGQLEDSWPDVTDWKTSGVSTYITLTRESDPKQISDRLNSLLRKLENENRTLIGARVFLQPISEIHLSSGLKDELEPYGSKILIYCLAFIGFLVLAIAWVNYVNLETARFISRLKEVSVRRIVGSSKSNLLIQFLVEYFCLSIVSICIALFILYFLSPHFKALTGITFGDIRVLNRETIVLSLTVFIIGSALVGIYPGIFLLRFNLISTLKGNIFGESKESSLRKYLVSFQFVISIVLISLVMVIHAQLDFMRFSNKKIEVEHVIALRNPTAYSGQDLKMKHSNFEVFKNKILQHSSVKSMTSSSAVPGTEIGFSFVNLIKRDTNALFDPTIYKTLFVDDDFISTYNLKLVAGRNFYPPKINTDWIEPWMDPSWTTIILNESAIKGLGFKSPQDAVDQTIYYQLFDGFLKYKIIGVIADYHHESVKKQVFPTILVSNYQTFQQVYYSIRLQTGGNPAEEVSYIEKTWKEVFSDQPFEYFFLDDYYDQQFKSEYTASSIFVSFATIAVIIACLGIFGMTLYAANSKLKEISIRKVLGASSSAIITLLSKDNIKVVGVSMIVSVPLINFITNYWLSNYPVKISISIFYYATPFLVVLLAVLITSGFQTMKAANSNPVDHLKNE